MDEQGQSPLEYADPQHHPQPRFTMHWGGWVLLVVMTVYFLAMAVYSVVSRSPLLDP